MTKESKEGDWRLDDLLARYSKTDGLKFHKISGFGARKYEREWNTYKISHKSHENTFKKKNSSGPSPHNLAVCLSDINQHSWIWNHVSYTLLPLSTKKVDFSQFSQLHNLECLSKQVFSGRGLRLPKQGVSLTLRLWCFFDVNWQPKSHPHLDFVPRLPNIQLPPPFFGRVVVVTSHLPMAEAANSCNSACNSARTMEDHWDNWESCSLAQIPKQPTTTQADQKIVKKNRQNTSFCSNSTVITVGVDVWWYLMIVVSISRQKIGLRFDQQRLHHCHVSSTFANQAQ